MVLRKAAIALAALAFISAVPVAAQAADWRHDNNRRVEETRRANNWGHERQRAEAFRHHYWEHERWRRWHAHYYRPHYAAPYVVGYGW